MLVDKEKLVVLIGDHAPINGIRIAIQASKAELFEEGEEGEVLIDTLEELVQSREIVEVEYILPGTDRVKSLFFPYNTAITIHNAV